MSDEQAICTVHPQFMFKTLSNATIKSLLIQSVDKKQITVNQYLNTSSCVFKMIKFILEDGLGKQITIEQIKNTLIEKYLTLNKRKIPTVLKKKGNTIFSLFSDLTFQKEAAKAVEDLFDDSEKQAEIQKQILLENYYPTEFDILLIFDSYNVPVIFKLKGNQHTLLANKLLMNVSTTGKSYAYIMVIDRRRLHRDKKIDYSLLSLEHIGYKIPKKLINKDSILVKKTTISNYIKESLTYLTARREIELEQDRQRKRKKKKPKKIGRTVLSTK